MVCLLSLGFFSGVFQWKRALPCLAFPAGYMAARAHRGFPRLPPCDGEVTLALRDRSVVSATGPLQVCWCALLSPRSQCGRAGVKAAEHRAPRGLALTQEPRAVHCEPLKEGAPTVEGQAQAERSRPRGTWTSLPWEAAQGGAAEPPQTAGRGGRATLSSGAASDPRSPSGMGGARSARRARPAVPRTGAIAGAAARVPGSSGA